MRRKFITIIFSMCITGALVTGCSNSGDKDVTENAIRDEENETLQENKPYSSYNQYHMKETINAILILVILK